MIHTENHGAVVRITFDRRERHNALDATDVDRLGEAVAAAIDAPETRALVITGAHGHFCAGADLHDAVNESFARTLVAVLDDLRHTTFPTIAAIEGYAIGAGTQIAVSCDLRVAAPSARFGIPAAKLGLMIDHWTVQRLAHIVGQGTARALLLGADTLDADGALRAGLAQRIGTLDDALGWAEHITQLAPLSLTGHKIALNDAEQVGGQTGRFDTAFRTAWESTDLQEGLAAFRERRPAKFTGR